MPLPVDSLLNRLIHQRKENFHRLRLGYDSKLLVKKLF